MIDKNIVLYALTGAKALGKKIAAKLNIKLSNVEISKFADGEVLVKPSESVRNKDVYLMQATSPPVNEYLMELLIAIDAMKRGSAKSINLIVPYYGYARQDRKSKGREPITSKLVADLLTNAGADRIVTVDLHSAQSMGFFNIPVDDLKPTTEISEWIFNYMKKEIGNPHFCIVSPDHGALIRARKIYHKLEKMNSNLAVIEKRRPEANVSVVEFILGDVKNKICFLIDDMIDTAGTICSAAKTLKQNGAKEIIILSTHAIFSPPACARLNELIDANIVNKIVVCDSVYLPENKRVKKLEIISISEFLADVMQTIMQSKSISDLYAKRNNSLLEKVSEYAKNQKIQKKG